MVRRAGQGHSAKAWLCSIPRPGLAAGLWIGSVDRPILGLQPVLLGAPFADRPMTFGELALTATASTPHLGGAAIGPAGAPLLMSAHGVGALPAFGVGCLFVSRLLLTTLCILGVRGWLSCVISVR